MSDRPSIAPAVIAAITARAPARLTKKLDANPAVALGWATDRDGADLVVRTDGEDSVRLPATGTIEDEGAITCSCLLSPRCFHVLAVASSLAIADAPPAASVEPSGADESPTATPAALVVLDATQQRVVRDVVVATGRCLAAGARQCGALLQGELLRAIHDARAEGLYRLAAHALEIVRAVRLLRASDASFRVADLVMAIGHTLDLADELDVDTAVDAVLLGTARREYVAAGALDLSGFASSPVVSATGFGGVVTSLVARDGSFYELSDVRPGDARRARAAYSAGVAVGDLALAHSELCRAGMFVQNATSSFDGRLGAGSGVRAVRNAGRGLDDPTLVARFAEDWGVQLARIASWRASTTRSVPSDAWAFLRGTVVARLEGGGLLLQPAEGEEPLVSIHAGFPHAELDAITNARTLGRAGLAARWVVRASAEHDELVAVAVGPDPTLPERTLRREALDGGIAMLAFDPISIAALPDLPEAPLVEPPRTESPVVSMERWVDRIALGGAGVVPEPALVALRRDASRLRADGLVTSARCLDALGTAATARSAPRDLSRAFLAAFLVVRVFRSG